MVSMAVSNIIKYEMTQIKECDVELVQQQASCTRERALEALVKAQGDIINAIVSIVGVASNTPPPLLTSESAPQANLGPTGPL